MQSFSAEIYIISKINPVVDVPEDVLRAIFEQAGKSKGAIPVRGKLNGAEFTHNMVKYLGKWRLYLNGPMRKAAGIDTGDMAEVEIEFDPMPRLEPMPEELGAGLKKNEEARAEFDKLAPSRQKEIMRYINSLKSDEARARNVRNVINHLTDKPADTLHALMRRPKN